MIRGVDLKIFGFLVAIGGSAIQGAGIEHSFLQGDLWGKVGVSADALI